MNRMYRIGLFLLAFVASISNITFARAVDNHSNYYRNFWHPVYHKQRLNYCSVEGKTCGLAIASRYCRMMGYERADQEIIAHNVGATRFMESSAYCRGWQCDGFKMIRCVDRLKHKPVRGYYYRLQRFVYPRFNHYRVDWCFDGQKDCGRRVAFSFCRRMGYTDVRHYRIARHVGATQAIGNQKLCFGYDCQGFVNIDCFR